MRWVFSFSCLLVMFFVDANALAESACSSSHTSAEAYLSCLQSQRNELAARKSAMVSEKAQIQAQIDDLKAGLRGDVKQTIEVEKGAVSRELAEAHESSALVQQDLDRYRSELRAIGKEARALVDRFKTYMSGWQEVRQQLNELASLASQGSLDEMAIIPAKASRLRLETEGDLIVFETQALVTRFETLEGRYRGRFARYQTFLVKYGMAFSKATEQSRLLLEKVRKHGNDRSTYIETKTSEIERNYKIRRTRLIEIAAHDATQPVAERAVALMSSAHFLDLVTREVRAIKTQPKLSAITGVSYVFDRYTALQGFLQGAHLCDDQESLKWKSQGCQDYNATVDYAKEQVLKRIPEYVRSALMGLYDSPRAIQLRPLIEEAYNAIEADDTATAARKLDSVLAIIDGGN